ncbi:polymorphic toxin-type HINT domain-containing protein [Streptosporangium sp. NBC_01810]|uniref:polymorphic toxin-type HINT domain-containing protein n=1 Tax=Streptosporangium sp. NBC_01810 TaxID=2975951 RepID=UPI002DD92D7C|nr:polymorphic toxin-type HINT domain-containing protein [Streptosporangium sp. NBC_01810]WSA27588.1 polymorphic toxin-type HINT domain-containing protein [Streptosporangium sp. NBC_01810]
MTPADEALVMTLQPTLSATVTSWAGGVAGFDFQVCDSPSMSGNCVNSDDYDNVCCGLSGQWPLPEGLLSWGKEYWWRVYVTDASTIGGQGRYSSTRSFTMGVRQPTITSNLSARGVNGQEFHQSTGNYTTTFTDAVVNTAGLPLSVVRSYNSMDPRRDGAFGAGWSTRFDMRIVPETIRGFEALLVTYPDGRTVRFADKGDGTFQPPPGTYATLATVTGGGWRLMDKSSTSYLFDTQGRLLRATDSQGRGQELTYGTDGKLSEVTATGGRSLSFTWTGAHVTTVSTAPVNGAPLTWTYSYTGDRLTEVCAPTTACTSFEYGAGSLYRSSVQDADPFGYWRLGEASGNAADLGWGAGSASYSGATRGRPGAPAGSTDTAVELTSSGYVELPSGLMPRLHQQGAVELWFKSTGTGRLVSSGEWSSTLDPVVQVGADGKLRASLRPTASPIVSTAVVNDGAWHHLVFTVAADKQTLYLDGLPAGTLTQPVAADNRGFTRIGGGLAGTVDEIAAYDRPLTAAEVAAHYAARVEAPNKLTKITLPSGRVWATNTYDSATERLTTHVDANGGTWQIGALAYNRTTGQSTVTVTDPRTETLTYVYDAWRGYRLVSRSDQLAKVTKYAYDTGGFLKTVTDPNNNVTERFYDKRGNLVGVKQCRSTSSCQTERHAYYLNTNDRFDARNDRPIASRDARSSSATDNTYATKWEYNQHGETLKQTTPATIDFPNGRATTFTYTDGTEPAVGGGTTPAGLVKTEKDARDNETTYRYSLAGDLAEKTTVSGLKIQFAYDSLGRTISQTEVSEATPGGVTTTFTYDGAGRLLTRTEPGVKNEVTDVTHTAKTTYTYDADGNPLTETLTDLTGGDPPSTTTYTYDVKGRLETMTGSEGGVARSTWDSTGAKASATDPLGTVFTYAYTKRGELTSTTIKNWTGSPVTPQTPQDVVLGSYSYDSAGRLAGQVDAMGRKTSYTYFTDNRLSQVIGDDVRLNGSTTTAEVVVEANTYDAAGNLSKQVTGGGMETVDYAYDAANRLTSSTFDPATLKRKIAYTYDATDNVTGENLTGAGSTRVESTVYTYNALGLVTQQSVENGADDLVSTNTYDDRGLLTATTDPRGNVSGATAADFTTTMRYDLLGQLVESKAPQVKIEKNGSATDGRPTMKYGYNNAGLATHTVDAEGRTFTSTFDKAGRLTSAIAPSYTPPGGSAVIPKVSFGYDAAGRQTTVADPRNYVTSTVYDALGRPVKVTEPGPSGPGGVWLAEYDLLGEQLAVIDPTGARVEATYDDLGRKITSTQVERTPTTAAHTTRLTYDTAGNLTKSVAPGPKTTDYTVNAAGQVTAVTDPLIHTSTVAYDFLGRTAKVTDPLGNATEAEYDLAARQIAAKDLNSTGTTIRTFGFGYDPAGNPTSTTSAEGRITRRTFDATDQMTSLIEPVTTGTSITTTFGYDATGARTRTTDGRGNATWTGYNTLGLVESVIEPSTAAHPGAADRTWTSVYDAAGNAVSILQPGGVRIDRTFDPLGQVVEESGSGASVTTPTRNFTYDAAGRITAIGDYTLEYNDRSLLTKVSKATNQVATYTYDAVGNPTQRVDPAGTANYTWDNADRLKTASDPVTGRTWTYGYDNADRLTSKTSASPVNTQSYVYDTVDRLTSHSLKNSSGTELSKIVYGWDKDDNLTTKTTTGTAGAGTNTYSYDHAGRLTSWTAPGGAVTAYTWDDSGNRTTAGAKTFTYDERNRIVSGGGTDYTYTPRGTTATETKAGVTRDLTFDAFDRLISDGDATYGYDSLGRMTSRTKGVDQRRFVYSGLENDITTVADGANTTLAKYGRDPFGGLLSLQEGGTAALGSMTDLHDDLVATFSGTALVDSTAYDPFGEVTHRAGTQRSLGYQGEYTDPDTGKVNMHARWYQPGTGAFTSRDDWTLDPQPSIQANRYTYGNGNPMVNSDPSGHWNAMDTSGGRGTYSPPRPATKSPPKPSFASKVIGAVGRGLAKRVGQYMFIGGIVYYSINGKPLTLNNSNTKLQPNTRPWNPPRSTRAPLARVKQTSKTSGSSGPCTTCNTTSSTPRPPKPPEIKKSEPYKPDFDPNSKEFKNDPNNGTEDRGPGSGRTPREWEQYLCTLGPCRSYGGHVGIEINGATGGGGGGGISCEDWNPGNCGRDACSESIGFLSSTSVSGCVPSSGNDLGNGTARSRNFPVPDTGVDPDWYPDAPPPPPVSCSPSGFNSFVPGTKVLMADGTTKPIEDVEVGDWVVAADAATGLTAARRVSHLITGDGEKHLVRITVTPDGTTGKSGTLVATDGHPFWVPDLRKWVKAGELQPGMLLRTSAGTYVQLTAIKKWTTPQRVHNLTVEGLHTYHVLAGDQAILVHNAGPGRGLGDDEIYLWRAVQDSELAGIHGNRSYHNPLGYETKYFAFTEEGAREYGRRAYGVRPQEGPYTVTRTTIQKGKIPPSSIMPPTADVPGGGVALPTDLLDELGRPRIMPQSSC